MDVTFPDGTRVPGKTPIVIIGPNGVGKTRLGVSITRSNNADRIAALRNVEIPEIPMQRASQANQQVQSALQEVLDQHWRQSFELRTLMAEILAEDRECAVTYRQQREDNPAAKPDETLTKTRLQKITEIWNRHFPGRKIKLDYEPMVERTVDGQTTRYSIAQMSEGERTALFLAARVVSCNKSVLLVDEPESFFHPLLARRLWNDLEEYVPDIRFVYITHDIPFALSRRSPTFAIARSETRVDVLQAASSLPQDVIGDVLGAASFSISASRIVFLEGKLDSLDYEILSAWHNCPKTAVAPVGGCDAVRECVAVFRAGKVTTGVDTYGYIDRDNWPNSYLGSDPSIKAHPVNEIEGLLCDRDIFLALAGYYAIDAIDAAARYDSFISVARKSFSGAVFNKLVLDRSKKRAEIEQRALFNPIKPDEDIKKVRNAFETASPAGGWTSYLGQLFTEEEARLTASLNGAAKLFVQDFPAKSYYAHAAQKLGMTPEAIVRTICEALTPSDKEAEANQKLKILRDSIVTAWSGSMWPRRI